VARLCPISYLTHFHQIGIISAVCLLFPFVFGIAVQQTLGPVGGVRNIFDFASFRSYSDGPT
jgi:hypothetical protein